MCVLEIIVLRELIGGKYFLKYVFNLESDLEELMDIKKCLVRKFEIKLVFVGVLFGVDILYECDIL